MRASAVSDALRVLVGARQPVFIWGGPGVGKSARTSWSVIFKASASWRTTALFPTPGPPQIKTGCRAATVTGTIKWPQWPRYASNSSFVSGLQWNDAA